MTDQETPDYIFEIADFGKALQATQQAVSDLMTHTLKLPEHSKVEREGHMRQQLELYGTLMRGVYQMAEVATGIDMSDAQAMFATLAEDAVKDQRMMTEGAFAAKH